MSEEDDLQKEVGSSLDNSGEDLSGEPLPLRILIRMACF